MNKSYFKLKFSVCHGIHSLTATQTLNSSVRRIIELFFSAQVSQKAVFI